LAKPRWSDGNPKMRIRRDLEEEVRNIAGVLGVPSAAVRNTSLELGLKILKSLLINRSKIEWSVVEDALRSLEEAKKFVKQKRSTKKSLKPVSEMSTSETG